MSVVEEQKDTQAGAKTFYAYEIHDATKMPLVTAGLQRKWMEETNQRFAHRCLPLNMANTAGWFVLSPSTFSVIWNGGHGLEDLSIGFPAGEQHTDIKSHFGHGILTINLPYLFQTPKDINLWVKGPSNWPKDGLYPLEGLVEADWAHSTFTMNWMLTRANHPVRFEEGEPVCMLLPLARGLAESLDPVQTPLKTNPSLDADYRKWAAGRAGFLGGLQAKDTSTVARGWEKDYFKGLNANGQRIDTHQVRADLKEFQRAT